MNNNNAGIQYVGLSGITQACSEAVMRLVQFRDQIRSVKILSRAGTHALLLTINADEVIAVKTGFSSGYAGEGPSAFSWVLALLEECGAVIEEFNVRQDVLDRVDESSLTVEDVSELDETRPVQPSRWHGYILEEHWRNRREILVQHSPLVMPYALVDARIMDLALKFFDSPDESLLTGYRRLEGIVRDRIGVDDHGYSLFSQAFGEKGKFAWDGLSADETKKRGLLFIAAYGAYRNPRAHREQADDPRSVLAEFLLLNHLYMLERDARPLRQGERAGKEPVASQGIGI